MSSKRVKFSPEFKEAAVREVIDRSRSLADVARENGLVAQTLGHPDCEREASPETARRCNS